MVQGKDPMPQIWIKRQQQLRTLQTRESSEILDTDLQTGESSEILDAEQWWWSTRHTERQKWRREKEAGRAEQTEEQWTQKLIPHTHTGKEEGRGWREGPPQDLRLPDKVGMSPRAGRALITWRGCKGTDDCSSTSSVNPEKWGKWGHHRREINVH